MSTLARRALNVASPCALALLTFTGLAAAGARASLTEANSTGLSQHRIAVAANAPREGIRPWSDGPLVVAVALGASGTVGSDAFAPYEVFADSPQFSVYTVAATASAQPTQGGPSIVPTYTFADTESGRAPQPDVVVVPAVATPDGPSEAALRSWITGRAAAGARILAVCNGSSVLAATGLLDGRTATGHWSRITALTDDYPAVSWRRGQRFVQDGPITTTAGITSGIPGALRVMADLAGPAEAIRVGALVGYPNWSLTGPTDIPARSFSLGDVPVGLNALIPWGRPTVGIALRDGVGEIDLASSFEVFDVSFAARATPVSASGTVVTQHGLVLHTNTTDDEPAPTQLAVPGPGGVADLDPSLRLWAERNHLRVDAIHGPGAAPGFDGALEYLAAQAGRDTAVSTAKMIDYPIDQLQLSDGSHGRTSLFLALGLALTAASASVLPVMRRHRRNRARAHRAEPEEQRVEQLIAVD